MSQYGSICALRRLHKQATDRRETRYATSNYKLMNMDSAKIMRRRRFELLVFAAYLCTPECSHYRSKSSQLRLRNIRSSGRQRLTTRPPSRSWHVRRMESIINLSEHRLKSKVGKKIVTERIRTPDICCVWYGSPITTTALRAFHTDGPGLGSPQGIIPGWAFGGKQRLATRPPPLSWHIRRTRSII